MNIRDVSVTHENLFNHSKDARVSIWLDGFKKECACQPLCQILTARTIKDWNQNEPLSCSITIVDHIKKREEKAPNTAVKLGNYNANIYI